MTPGPWRWADWDAEYGTWEVENNKLWLEHNPIDLDDPGSIVRQRDDESQFVLRLEDDLTSAADKELIRRAPELRDALQQMLDMFWWEHGLI